MRFSFDALEPRSLFAAGALDITYGNGAGVGTDLLPAGDLVVTDKALQPGDRLLVSGRFTPAGGVQQNFLARYTAEGKRDNHFVGSTTVMGNPRGLEAIDLIGTQSDGKILLLDHDAGEGIAKIVRLTASGKVDNSFGAKGSVTFPFVSARRMIVGQGDAIIVAGDDGDNVQVAELTAGGKLNAGFAAGGVFTGKLNLAGSNSEGVTFTRTIEFVSQTPDGKIELAGSFKLHEVDPPSDFVHPFIARLTTAGTLDSTFDSNGTLEFTDQGNSTTDGFATLSNGKVLIAISTSDTSTLLRVNVDGTVDRKFGFSGAAALDGTSRALVVSPAGDILVQTPSQFQRFAGDGSLQSDFNDNNPSAGDGLVGLGSDGSILSVAVSFKSQSNGLQYKIRPARRWGELAPAGLLAADDITNAPAGPYRFSIQWRAELGVDVKTLASQSIQIAGPDGLTYRAVFLGTTKTGNGIQRTANYKFSPPGGSWDASDNGKYAVRLLGGVVKDTQGNASSKQSLGGFTVQLSIRA